MKHYVLQYIAPEQLMNLFKLFIYTCICINGYSFIGDDIAAAEQTLNGNSSFSDIFNQFAVTMDTIAWITLIFLFELETWVLDDETFKLKRVRWTINGLTALCYMVILYAFVGYVGKLLMLLDSTPYIMGNVCDLVDTAVRITTSLDEYAPITAESCQLLNPDTMGQIHNQAIVFENSQYGEIKLLAWIDVINSGTWLLVVVLLQADIIMQLRGLLNPHIMRVSMLCKAILYSTLFIVAIFWGVYGTFTDFWDAVLWLLGFIVIDLNVFNWNQEEQEEAEALAKAG